MTAFDNREKMEENKYAHDKEVQFIVNARYHKLLGAWVAEQSKLEGRDAECYIETIITEELNSHDENKLFEKVRHDLLSHDAHISDHDIREKMYNLLQDAKEQVQNGK